MGKEKRYNTKKLLDQALSFINTNNDIIFVDEVIDNLPICKRTFYNHFPIESSELTLIHEAIEKNKIKQKRILRRKWLNSDSSNSQIALYKLIGTEEERMALAMTKVDGNLALTTPVNLIFKDDYGDEENEET